MLEAILSIQAGDNPRVLAEKLESFLAAGASAARREGRARGRRGPAELRRGGMSGHGRGRRPPARRHGGGHEGGDERWLLTYADMITLLMALFMVLFSISSVNISKYQVLQRALQKAFIGGVLDGGKGVPAGDAHPHPGRADRHASAAGRTRASTIMPATTLGEVAAVDRPQTARGRGRQEQSEPRADPAAGRDATPGSTASPG